MRQKNVLAGRAGSVKTGMPCRNISPDRLSVPYPTDLCSDLAVGSISQQGLVLRARQLQRQAAVSEKQSLCTQQSRCGFHPARSFSKEGQPETGNVSASLCWVHTIGSTVSTEDTGGRSRGPAPSVGGVGEF